MVEKNRNFSIVDGAVKIDGTLSANSRLIIKGNLTGIIKAEHLTITKEGYAHANIMSSTIIIGGMFKGEINATKELIILSSGNCSGKILCNNLVIEPGAIVNAEISDNSSVIADTDISKKTINNNK